MIGFDQKPEQQNKELKMHGATLNLSDECVFTEWAVAGPDIARVITEFEAGVLTRKNAVLKYHDPSPIVQQVFFSHTPSYWLLHFKRQVTLLTRIVTKSSLSTPENMTDNVARSIMGAHGEGNKQHADLVMRASSHSVTMPIRR